MGVIFNVEIKKKIFTVHFQQRSPVSCWHSVIYFIKKKMIRKDNVLLGGKKSRVCTTNVIWLRRGVILLSSLDLEERHS